MPRHSARSILLVLLCVFVLGTATPAGSAGSTNLNRFDMPDDGGTGEVQTAVTAETIRYACEDGSGLDVVFKTGDAPSAELTSGDSKRILPQGPSGSGARYIEGDIIFWVKGDQALYQVKDKSTNCRTVPRITFSSNNSSATVNGSVTGYGTKSYIVAGKAGQTLRVKLTSGNKALYFSVADAATQESIEGGPVPGTVTEWSGTLPKDADYQIGVFLMRSEARRKRTAPYTLTVSVTGDAKAAVPSASAGTELTSSEWMLKSMMRGETRVEIPSGVAIRAKFEGRRVAGRAVCNNYFASYSVEDARITIGDVGATRMLCAENADLESGYFDLLKRAETFSMRDEQLVLKGPAGSLVFAKKF